MQKRLDLYLTYVDKVLNHELPIISAFNEESDYSIISVKDIAPTRKDYEHLLSRHIEQISFFQNALILSSIKLVVFILVSFISILYALSNQTSYLVSGGIIFITLLPTCIFTARYLKQKSAIKKLYKQYDSIAKKML